MKLDFLKVHDVSEILTKYNFSWLTTAGLTMSLPKLEIFLPLVIQIVFICFTQLFAIMLDYLRLKILNQKSKTKITIDKKNVKVENEIENDSGFK